MTQKLAKITGQLGLRISCGKTKVMCVGKGNMAGEAIMVNDECLDEVKEFMYLGSYVENNGNVDKDIRSRLGKAGAAFEKLRCIWRSKTIGLKMKLRLYKAIVLPTALYASETWRITKGSGKKLDAFHMRCLRSILKIKWMDHVTNAEVLKRAEAQTLQQIILERRLRFAGHVMRMNDDRLAPHAMTWNPANSKRRRGRPRLTWRKTVEADLKTVSVGLHQAAQDARDREGWKKLVARCVQQHGRT